MKSLALFVSYATLCLATKLVTHPDFPFHQLTVNDPTSLGIDRVNQAAGYMQVNNDAKLFYWFFESRNKPGTDPVILWLNGGPGCSSLEGLLFENGPATINSNIRPVRNPYSWNEVANVIYLDQPVGVGYSDGDENVSSTPQAAVDVEAFVNMFFKEFPQFAKNKFHIAGESYGGRYIPVFATQIMSNPNSVVQVSSIMIGNGLVDPIAQYQNYQPMLCGKGGYPQKLSSGTCNSMSNLLNACLNPLRSCINSKNDITCGTAQTACLYQDVQFSNLNPYDIRDSSCAPANDGLCYPSMDDVANYLNEQSVKDALGADNVDFESCNNDINARFSNNYDSFANTQNLVGQLLDQGIPALAYYGDKDIICNWLGGQQWTKDLQWSGAVSFRNAIANPKNWTVAGKGAGTVANHGPFTFLRVFDAGHMVPHNQPEHALDMVRRWIHQDFAMGTTPQ